jgi:hypothetical protein
MRPMTGRRETTLLESGLTVCSIGPTVAHSKWIDRRTMVRFEFQQVARELDRAR